MVTPFFRYIPEIRPCIQRAILSLLSVVVVVSCTVVSEDDVVEVEVDVVVVETVVVVVVVVVEVVVVVVGRDVDVAFTAPTLVRE